MVSVATIPVLLVGIVRTWNQYSLFRSLEQQGLRASASDLAGEVDDYIDKHLQAIETLTWTVPPSPMPATKAWENSLLRYHELYKSFLTLLVTDLQGRVLVAVHQQGNGHAIGNRGTDVSDREYFRRPMADGEPFVSPVFRGRVLGSDPLVAVSHVYPDANGRPAGVVEGSLDLKQFNHLAVGDKRALDGMVVLDSRNTVVYASLNTPFRVLDDLSQSALARPQSEAVFRLRYGHNQRDAGRDFLVGRAEKRSAYGWKVFVMEPTSVIQNLLLDCLWRAFCWLVIVTSIAFFLARVTARAITEPLEQLAGRVEGVGEEGLFGDSGAHEVYLHPETPAELRLLFTGFERMAGRVRACYAQLRAANSDLESRVFERTSELERSNLALHAALRRQSKAEEQLHLLDRAMSAAEEGITIVDALERGHPVVYVNRGFEHLTGYSAYDALGSGAELLLGEGTNPAALQQIDQAIAAQQPCTVELLNYRKDRSTFWNRVSVTPVHDADGQVTHFVCIHVDLTKHKELDRLKNELISTVSHELRTPLTSMRGFAELILRRNYPPERARQFLQIIYKETNHLTQLINDFLDISRIESGLQDLHLEAFDLRETIAELLPVFADGKEHHFDVLLNGCPVPVRADRLRIRQVLENLLSNARKFSPKRGRIEIGAKPCGAVVEVWVRDEGIGIPSESVPHLFQRFYRVDNTETRSIGGTGLGLELVRKIVEAHQGKVWVDSTPGQGSTFHFTVPS